MQTWKKLDNITYFVIITFDVVAGLRIYIYFSMREKRSAKT